MEKDKRELIGNWISQYRSGVDPAPDTLVALNRYKKAILDGDKVLYAVPLRPPNMFSGGDVKSSFVKRVYALRQMCFELEIAHEESRVIEDNAFYPNVTNINIAFDFSLGDGASS